MDVSKHSGVLAWASDVRTRVEWLTLIYGDYHIVNIVTLLQAGLMRGRGVRLA